MHACRKDTVNQFADDRMMAGEPILLEGIRDPTAPVVSCTHGLEAPAFVQLDEFGFRELMVSRRDFGSKEPGDAPVDAL